MKLRMLKVVVWCALVLTGAAAAGDAGSPGALHGPGPTAEKPYGLETLARSLRRQPVSPAHGPRGVLGADDELLEALAGAHGGNRLVVCGACRVRPAGAQRGPCLSQRCPAVMWRHRWALVRATCVAGLKLKDMRLLRTTKHERTCDALEKEPVLMAGRARRAVSWRLQPLWLAAGAGPRYDAALLELDRPFGEEDPPGNSTAAELCLQDIKYWMEKTDEEYRRRDSTDRIISHYFKPTTPYTLFMTGILPAATVFVFFLVIIFGTGTPIKVPYSNEKDGIKTPWMIDGYSSDVKCFPTYGQV